MQTPPRASSRTRRSAGYSLVELSTVMVILGVLASVAIPRLMGVTDQARAAALVSDGRLVERALLDYFVHHDAWPVPAEPGVTPEELRPFLPPGFSFDRGDARLAYGSLQSAPPDDAPVVSLHVADNPALLAALARLLDPDDRVGTSGSDGGGTLLFTGPREVLKTQR